ncbi:AAEL004714-PA [Aedes aegypti]|uniref:AAEL004714-PA n=1 Tax=Aedes aegypti TaxID=7159 RepID=Q17C27_AEDAE|nr:AAEL004714-PA [Aedes aegypti]
MPFLFSLMWLLLLTKITAYKISVDIHEFTNCPGKKAMIDFGYLDFSINDDGNMIFNGNFTVLKDIDSPYPLYIHSKKMERGEWVETIGFKFVKNFCATLDKVSEFWYPVMKYLGKQSCPLPAGVRADIIHGSYN